jgi:D-glycero-D-manno-heptose 1,7-bisphosphate phosphatase
LSEHLRRFVILDRDGTIIEERQYLSDPAQVKLVPHVASALREMQQLGFGLVVITNQSGIGRGLFDQVQLQQVHERVEELLRQEGVCLDGLYTCPHKPEDHCACRKPKIGLIQQAAKELGFSPEDSIVVGDKASDIGMGRMAGAVTFLVRTGYGAQVEKRSNVSPDYVVDDLNGAVQVIKRWLSEDQSEL